jgi:hypothetical protein
MNAGNPFNAPNPGTPESWFAFHCVDRDYLFQNTAARWLSAYRYLAHLTRRDALEAPRIFRHRGDEVWDRLRRRCGPLPAGQRVPANEVPAGPLSVFALASRVYYYLEPNRRRALEKAQDPDYRDPIQPGDARSLARCACFFAARTHNGDDWRNYFNAHQVIGGHKGFLFISEQDKIDAVARRIAPAYGSRAAEFYRIVGKPKFGVASDTDFDDYAIRMRLRVPDTEFYVPSLIDAEAYEFFLPNGQRDPRRGRTVYVG